jgi:hypothetical protein
MLNDKDAITDFATIIASRKKLPLCGIAKGVTAWVESSQLESHPDISLTIPRQDGRQQRLSCIICNGCGANAPTLPQST